MAVDGQGEVTFLPRPSELELHREQAALRLSDATRILFETREAPRERERSLEPLARVLAGELEILTGRAPVVVEWDGGQVPPGSDILLRFSSPATPFPETEAEEVQGYQLRTTAKGCEVRAPYYKAVAYGTATLLQALGEDERGFYLPAMTVKDSPAAAYRGISLDVARQPHSIEVIQSVVDMARLYKIRYLQLHLTDDQLFTFPYPGITDRLERNISYSREDLVRLVEYADHRGVTLIPEMDLPGHSARLKESGYLEPTKSDRDVADPANFAKIQAVMDEMLIVFASSPYFHIGGDESSAGSALEPFLAAMNEHLRDDPPGGKRRLLVWEGFGGAPVEELPATGEDRILVMAWESSYNAPWNLLRAGYEVINCSWKPMYVVGGGTLFHPGSTGGRKFFPEEIHRWHKDLFMHWEPGRPVYEDAGPRDADRTDHEWDASVLGLDDQILGGQLLFWEQEEKSVMNELIPRLPVMAERLWNPGVEESFAAVKKRSQEVSARLLPIVQPVAIVAGVEVESFPINDIYQPYEGAQLEVKLENRTRIDGEIRYELGGFSNQMTGPYFPAPEAPGESSSEYEGPFSQSGGFSVRARLFREDGSLVGGDTFQFFNNWENRVQVTEFQLEVERGASVPDMEEISEREQIRSYQLPFLRGPFRNVDLIGQLHESLLIPPASGDYTISAKTQSGHASVFLDLNQDGKWQAGEKLIVNTPNSEEEIAASPVRLEAGKPYRLRVDHKTGIPRPVLLVYLDGPGTEGKKEISPYLHLVE
ncbi:family 20 glycosylhydrolase [Roseibacillus ishigakijimensis]|uniref:beta-N-acetylhexosaminidase n=1 Tax=Roseibacillus ishigakijimensis TaxID=454146 RepID=A0A934RLT0_9BACT|nr:family 20 glycosylhydrolase [Roseibacillus ishigakijimensis]MBK1833744.1 family 20 glycosylhydrolase [Roseibacillus ishigakijimensis]